MRRLKRFLDESKTTQAELASRLGVSQPTISDWIGGNIRPSIDRLGSISRVTGIPVADLVADLTGETAS